MIVFGSAGGVTGAAWLSSARVVRCWVKSRNERNPHRMLPSGNAGHSCETAGDKPEEGGDDVKSSWPLRVGLQTCYNGGDSEQPLRKEEEGEDDVKASWPLRPGLHTCYNGAYRGKRYREVEWNPKSVPKFGLESATRLHEVGIASNRKSECCGEYVPGPCTHRPSHHGSGLHQK